MLKSTLLRRRTLTAALLLLATRVAASANDNANDNAKATRLAEAIAGPQRSAENRARDGARHPFETLRFFGVEPGQTVVEIAPGGGWYTEILAPYLRKSGELYVAHFPADAPDPALRQSRERFVEKLAQSPEAYSRVHLGSLPSAGRGFTDIAPPGGADRVLTFRNIHNWIQSNQLDDMLRAFHAVLKPGGVLGVEEHRAAPGTPLARIVATGYVTEDLVVERARAAGFDWNGKNEVNANRRDTKDHPDGVWSLPPTLRGGDADKARFLAIGESDRMTLKFSKPVA